MIGFESCYSNHYVQRKKLCVYIYIYIKYFISYKINNTKKQMSNCKLNFAFLIIKYKYIYF